MLYLVAPQSADPNRKCQEFQGYAMFTCNQINTRNDQTYQMYKYIITKYNRIPGLTDAHTITRMQWDIPKH